MPSWTQAWDFVALIFAYGADPPKPPSLWTFFTWRKRLNLGTNIYSWLGHAGTSGSRSDDHIPFSVTIPWASSLIHLHRLALLYAKHKNWAKPPKPWAAKPNSKHKKCCWRPHLRSRHIVVPPKHAAIPQSCWDRDLPPHRHKALQAPHLDAA